MVLQDFSVYLTKILLIPVSFELASFTLMKLIKINDKKDRRFLTKECGVNDLQVENRRSSNNGIGRWAGREIPG